MSPATRFAIALFARGIEFTLCNNRLGVWPAKAYRTLTAEERAFIREHRAELKVLAAEGEAAMWDRLGAFRAANPSPTRAEGEAPDGHERASGTKFDSTM